MERFQWTEVHGRIVLKQDFSNLEHLELMKYLDQCHELIKAKGASDIILVTNLDNVGLDHQVVKHFCKICEVNRPYIGASAIYNAGAVQRATIEASAEKTNRKFLLFYDDKAVEKWLNTL